MCGDVMENLAVGSGVLFMRLAGLLLFAFSFSSIGTNAGVELATTFALNGKQ